MGISVEQSTQSAQELETAHRGVGLSIVTVE